MKKPNPTIDEMIAEAQEILKLNGAFRVLPDYTAERLARATRTRNEAQLTEYLRRAHLHDKGLDQARGKLIAKAQEMHGKLAGYRGGIRHRDKAKFEGFLAYFSVLSSAGTASELETWCEGAETWINRVVKHSHTLAA